VRGRVLGVVVAAVLTQAAVVRAQPAGAIEAEVRYGGAPMVDRVKVTRDAEHCGPEAKVERVVVGPAKGLAHAVVSVAGLQVAPLARPPRVIIEHRDCEYRPHVVAMRAGEIDIVNADGILHNVHTFSSANSPVNRAQPRSRKVLTERLEMPEIVKITCDIHPWALGWIAVFDHPYFAVTGAGGVARIDAVPAGRHVVEVWHEVLGKQTRTVEVRAGHTVRVAIEMKR